MALGRRAGARHVAAFNRDYARYLAAFPGRDPGELGRRARRLFEEARAHRIRMNPNAALNVGLGLLWAGRPLDATRLMSPVIHVDGVGVHQRVALVHVAEESGRFSIAREVGAIVLADPKTSVEDRLHVLEHVFEAERQAGQLSAAATRLEQFAAIVPAPTEPDAPGPHSWLLVGRGLLAWSGGDLAAAEHHFQHATQAVSDPAFVSSVHALLADLSLDRGDTRGAATALDRADRVEPTAMSMLAPSRSGHGYRLMVRGRLLSDQGARGDAVDVFEEAEAVLTEGQRAPLVAHVHAERGRCLIGMGQSHPGRGLLHQARREFAGLGCALDVATIDRELVGGPRTVSAFDQAGTEAVGTATIDPAAWGLRPSEHEPPGPG